MTRLRHLLPVSVYVLFATPFPFFIRYARSAHEKYIGWVLFLGCGLYAQAVTILLTIAALRSWSYRQVQSGAGNRVRLIMAAIVAAITLNAVGFAWGWIVGDLRWRTLQRKRAPIRST